MSSSLSKILSLLISIQLITACNSALTKSEAKLNPVDILQKYIQIDTSNPPGNELNAAKFLSKILKQEGIESTIFDLGNNRANIYARIKGDGSKKPIVFIHHMDVVPAEKKYWSVDPFAGTIKDGYIYGRGAVDIKGMGVVNLVSFINIYKENYKLKRDLIFLGVADEEEGSLGSRWMIKNKFNLIKDAEFLIDEGTGVILNKNNEIQYYAYTIGEKAPLWLTLTFTGESGHGSLPIKNSAVDKAIQAGQKILNRKIQYKILPELTDNIMVQLQSQKMIKPTMTRNEFTKKLKDSNFLKMISKNPEVNALITDTIAVTGMSGSDKVNTIPNEASLKLDCRLLPGTDKDQFIKNLKALIGDKTLKITVDEYLEARKSPAESDFSKALQLAATQQTPKTTKLVPMLLTSSTDSALYREVGIKSYGFESYTLTQEEMDRAHGNDEYKSIKSLQFGIDLQTQLIKNLNK